METKLEVSEVVAATTGMAFCASVLHLYGLTIATSFPIFSFLSLSDYLSYSIRILVPVIAAVSVGVVIELFTRRTERGLSESEIAERTKNPAKTIRMRRLPYILLTVMSLFPAFINTIVFLISRKNHESLFGTYRYALPILWFVLAAWYKQEPRLVQNWSRIASILFLFIPALMLYSFFDGLYKGHRFNNGKAEKYYVNFQGTTNQNEIETLLFLDKYVIYKDQNNVEVLRTTDISKIWKPK